MGSTALSGTAAASGPYDGPISKTYQAATVDPSTINTLTNGGGSPDSEGEGEEVDRTIPKKAPEASGTARGGGGDVQTSAPEGGLVETDFDGLSALDVRGVVPSDGSSDAQFPDERATSGTDGLQKRLDSAGNRRKRTKAAWSRGPP